MQNNIGIINQVDKSILKFYNNMYTVSIAKEVATSSNSTGNAGILIIGMVIVIVGLVGFILTKNK